MRALHFVSRLTIVASLACATFATAVNAETFVTKISLARQGKGSHFVTFSQSPGGGGSTGGNPCTGSTCLSFMPQ